MASDSSPKTLSSAEACIARVTRVSSKLLGLVQRVLVESDDVWVVRGPLETFTCESICARCLSPATGHRRVASPSGTKTIPYCQQCLERFAERGVAQLGWILSCVLLGIAGCIFFPLIPWLSMTAAMIGALAFASAPWIVGQLWLAKADFALRKRSAAYVTADGLICSNAEWATRLAQQIGCEVVHQRMHGRMTLGWSVAGLVVAGVLTPGLYDTFHCDVRIVNLTEQDLEIFIDGRLQTVTKPTTYEHPLAGSRLRVAMGWRRLEARTHEGALIHADSVHIGAGQSYLYAPAHPADTCFWIERTALGRAHEGMATREDLPVASDFWQMPVSIDAWFTPANGSESRFFTGGVVTSLRQGRCQSPATNPSLPTPTHF